MTQNQQHISTTTFVVEKTFHSNESEWRECTIFGYTDVWGCMSSREANRFGLILGWVFPDILRVPKQRDAFLVVGARPGTTPLRPKNAGSLQNAPGQHEVAEFPEGSAKTYILDYTGLYHMIKGIIFFIRSNPR